MHGTPRTWLLLLLWLSPIALPAADARGQDPRIDVSAVVAADGANGAARRLWLTIRIPQGYHLYGPRRVPNGPRPLRIGTDAPASVRGAWRGPRPRSTWDSVFETTVEYYEETVSLAAPIEVAAPAPAVVPVRITGQLCNDRICVDQDVSVSVAWTAAPPTRTLPPEWVALPVAAPAPDRRPATAPPAAPDAVSDAPGRTSGDVAKLGLWTFLLMAFAAGLGALATPCVFPMVPITISFFSKFSGGTWRRTAATAATYAGTIIAVYTAVGIAVTMIWGVAAMQRVATHPAFNAFVVALLLFFGANLLGLFDLRLPTSWISRSADAEQRWQKAAHTRLGRLAAVFFMALTFTLVSFSCTVGFLGGWVLPLAARGDALYPTIGMLAFSTAFALPFFLLALFPDAAARLTGRAGDWMHVVKATFGLLELAAAWKFASNLDLYFQWGLLTRDVVLWAWSLLFGGGALYILGVFHPTRPRIGWSRAVLSALLLAAAALCIRFVGTTDSMGSFVDGWLPPVDYPGDTKTEETDTTVPYLVDDIDGALSRGAQEGRFVFIDFTGYQCANCRAMETAILSHPDIAKRLRHMICVKAYTDGSKPVHRAQRDYQVERFGTATLPFYALLAPDGEVVATFSGMTRDVAQFAAFLDKALRRPAE